MADTEFGKWWESNIYEPVSEVANNLGDGIRNFWYNLTGQTEKTSAYQALMEREDSAYQRAAEDMKKAGLSKFGGVNPASSTSAPHTDPIAKSAELAQLRGFKLANKQAEHDLYISKKYGIRSSDKNVLAPLESVYNLIFGEKGILPGADEKLLAWLKGILFPDNTPAPAPSNPSMGDPSVEGTGYVPITIDAKPTGSQVGADFDKHSHMVISVDQLRNMDQKAWTSWMNDQFMKQLEHEKESGIGKVGNYEKLPESLTSQFNHTYENDLDYFINQLRASPYGDEASVVRMSKFLASKYNKSYNDVYKAMSKGVFGN